MRIWYTFKLFFKEGLELFSGTKITFDHFKCFKTTVEKEIGMPIKCLMTDRGGEFNSVEFNDFCKQHGVKKQLTTTYTPQKWSG